MTLRIEKAIENLQSADADKRWLAVDTLTALAPFEFLQQCRQCLTDSDWRVRALTLHYFYDVLMDKRFVSDERRRLISTLEPLVTPLTKDVSGAVAFNAVSVLNLMVDDGYYCGLSELIAALDDSRSCFGSKQPKELAEDDYPVLWAAAKALGDFGPRAAAAVPKLIQLLRDSGDDRVKTTAAESIRKIQAQPTLS